MNFTDQLPYKSAEYSNNGFNLAISKGKELTVFDSQSFTRTNQFVFPDVISSVQWSPDDKFVMCVVGKNNEVHLRCFDINIIEN